MRISDWSSDVCSSDLVIGKALHDAHPQLTCDRVRFDANTFELHRQEVDIDEEIHCGICPPVALSFRAVLKPVLPSGAIQLPAPETDANEGTPYFQRYSRPLEVAAIGLSTSSTAEVSTTLARAECRER